jgi:predicted MPP superfamily phosphohydrolase
MILLDLYVYQAVKVVSHSASPKAKGIISITYWTISILAVVIFVLLPYLHLERFSATFRNAVFATIIGLFFGKLIIGIFLLLDDLRRIFQWASGKLFFSQTEGEDMQDENRISRSVFLSWLGIAAGSGLFGSLIYGFSNKYNYQVKKIALQFPNLPAAFKGLRVIHISDIHSGSFNNKAAVEKGIDKILSLQPDLILFTGDLVNNKAGEMDSYIHSFSKLKAPMGVYSVLGNHDYGDYVKWDSEADKAENLQQLIQVHAGMGWKLLMNENVVLEREKDKVALLGVENWSAKANFPKYGKMHKAYEGVADIPFKVLLSHDPSHWDAEVKRSYKDIDLMLSGHTHGMQFGVELPGFKWSPVQYVYKQWAGLYEDQHQKLYVNRGFGFLGYPGRVGILPEITLIELS